MSSLLRHNCSPKPLRGDLESHGKGQHLVGAQAGDHHARARSCSWWSKASPSVSANEAFRTAEGEEPRFRKRLGKYDWEICSSSPHRITHLDFCVPLLQSGCKWCPTRVISGTVASAIRCYPRCIFSPHNIPQQQTSIEYYQK